MQSTRTLLFASLLAVGACAPSPLFVGKSASGTPGEVPRDERGEPVWTAIAPPPPPPAPAPAIDVNPGPPIQTIPPTTKPNDAPPSATIEAVPVPAGTPN